MVVSPGMEVRQPGFGILFLLVFHCNNVFGVSEVSSGGVEIL